MRLTKTNNSNLDANNILDKDSNNSNNIIYNNNNNNLSSKHKRKSTNSRSIKL